MDKVSDNIAKICRQFLLICMLLSLFTPCSLVFADNIILLQSSSEDLYNNLSTEIKSQILTECVDACDKNLQILQMDIDGFNNYSASPDEDLLIITLGVRAYQAALNPSSSDNRQYVHALMPKKETLETANNRFYFFIEVNPEDIVRLTQQLLKPEKPLLIFYSDETAWRIRDYAEASTKYGIELKTIKTSFTKIGRDLSQTENQYAAVIMLPDKELYNRQTIRQVLLEGFTLNLPFIGYSSALTRLGTTISFVSPLNQHAKDIGGLAHKLISRQKINKQFFYSSKVDIKVNQNISDAMDLNINESSVDNEIEILE